MTARAVALDTLRALSTDELAAHLREQRGQLFQVRLQQTIGQVENHRQIRAIRREIARTMTVQVEYRLALERGEVVPAPAAAPTAPVRRGRRAVAEEPAPAAPSRSRRQRAAEEAEAQASAEPVAVEEPAGAEATDELEAVSDVEVERSDQAADDQLETDDITGATAAADEDKR
jgi:ribosomal protein L29